MRNPFLALVIGALCGAVSVGLVHYGYYQHTAYVVRDQAEKDAGQPLPPELHDHPEKFLDLLFEKDGIKSRGWLGFMAWRATIGENIIGEHNMKLTGIGMWILWGFEAAIVVVIAAEVSVLTAKRPYCEDCDCWFASPLPLLALPPAKLPDAVAALKSGDPQQVQKLFPIPYYDKVGGSAIISLHVCPRCKESLADVRLQAAGGKDLVDKTRLSGLSIPPEVAAVILVRAAEIATKPMWTPWSPKPPATENPSAAVGTSVDTRKTGSS